MKHIGITSSTVSREIDFMEGSFSELIDHIVNVHHGYLYRTLPEIEQYLYEIENVDGTRHQELTKVRMLFTEMHKELVSHLPKEELDMFPAIKRFEQEQSGLIFQKCRRMIEKLEDEHESCESILKQIREITGDYTLPEEASATHKLTYQRLQELELDLFQHIYLENNILFPRVMNTSV